MAAKNTNPREVGERILAGLAKGRDRINAVRKRQARATRGIVQALAEQDAKRGFPARGRAERIAAKLRTKGISRTTVYRHYSALFSVGQKQ